MRNLCIITALLILAGRPVRAQVLTGTVQDVRTKKGVPYVNLGIPAKSLGIITDDNGSFSFKLTDEQDVDTIHVYSMGYKPLSMSFKQFRGNCDSQLPISLEEMVYQLATTVVRPNDYETKIMGAKNVAELECMNLGAVTTQDTATLRKFKEKGLNEKSIGIELGNKIQIDKGQQTFIDHIQFKTCAGPNDTAIYRVNIYSEGKTLERHYTPIGVIKVVTMQNIVKEPIIIKTIGKTEVHDVDLSKQNIEVEDDFIVALECIYSSNRQMNIGTKANIFGATDLLFRESIMDQWVKVPLIDVTFISATVTYKKKKGFFARLFD